MNIAPFSRDQPERSQPSKQTNKMVEVDIHSLLKINSHFDLLFNDNVLNQYLSSVYYKSATI